MWELREAHIGAMAARSGAGGAGCWAPVWWCSRRRAACGGIWPGAPATVASCRGVAPCDTELGSVVGRDWVACTPLAVGPDWVA